MKSERAPEGSNGPTLEPVVVIAPDELLEVEVDEAELDPEAVVEAVEQLLREGAPHDFDVLVIGSGPGGLAAACHLARRGLHVALVEERELGGVSLNRGCVPTKTLLESIAVLRLLRHAKTFGIHLDGELRPDFPAIHRRKADVVASLRNLTRQMLEEANVEVIEGRARFVEAHTLDIESNGQIRRVMAVHVVVATGGLPSRPTIPGADLPSVVTSDEILEQDWVPPRLAIAGASAIGVEFASIFAGLGTKVTLLERGEAVLPGEDEDIQAAMRRSLEEIGVEIVTSVVLDHIADAGNGLALHYQRSGEDHGEDRNVRVDEVLLATGRQANIADLGLEAAGIEIEDGKISVGPDKSTNQSGVYAIGDCSRRPGWASQASLEGRQIADVILGVSSNIDARYVPACYFTFPEVASVGLTLKAAHELGIKAHSGKFPFRANQRAAISGDEDGFVKLVIESETCRLLGCQIVGPRATEIINEASLALRDGTNAGSLLDALHAHPTFAEALPGAARVALDGGSEIL